MSPKKGDHFKRKIAFQLACFRGVNMMCSFQFLEESPGARACKLQATNFELLRTFRVQEAQATPQAADTVWLLSCVGERSKRAQRLHKGMKAYDSPVNSFQGTNFAIATPPAMLMDLGHCFWLLPLVQTELGYCKGTSIFLDELKVLTDHALIWYTEGSEFPTNCSLMHITCTYS